ncbi:unnamed protein product [Lepeophtheirus salmonis]|uniref:(salmon louse) hypothetical protein n=1 Tax=Lepeophtheirus salmonis TaxID=72036 RepID=A0A7R8CNI4_LEPSM|nr:unnamed protein product [Lepeophtheirus salmonis]CAF2875564.1 unnamed protein product [Lepeophtheirus salmonis]
MESISKGDIGLPKPIQIHLDKSRTKEHVALCMKRYHGHTKPNPRLVVDPKESSKRAFASISNEGLSAINRGYEYSWKENNNETVSNLFGEEKHKKGPKNTDIRPNSFIDDLDMEDSCGCDIEVVEPDVVEMNTIESRLLGHLNKKLV